MLCTENLYLDKSTSMGENREDRGLKGDEKQVELNGKEMLRLLTTESVPENVPA